MTPTQSDKSRMIENIHAMIRCNGKTHTDNCTHWQNFISHVRSEERKSALEKVKELVEELRKFKEGWDKFSKRQHELLVEGQDLKSASKNWEDFPEDFSFDFEPLLKVFAAFDALQDQQESKP